jgi:head-tail adaptor
MSVVLCPAEGQQTHLRGTTDGAGGAIFAWRDDRAGASSTDIYAQRVDATGTVLWDSLGVPVDTSASVQQFVHVASDNAGGAYVMWLDIGLNPDAVRLARIDGNGNAVWVSSKTLSTGGFNAQVILYRTQLVEDGAGGVIAVWADIGGDIYAQRVDAAGMFLWGPSGTLVGDAVLSSSNPTVAADGAGGAVISWRDFRTVVESNIYAQKLDANGAAQWTAGGEPVSVATGNQFDPVIAFDGAGGAIIAWKDGRSTCEVYAQRMDALGNPRWTVDGKLMGFIANFCPLETPAIAADGSGGAIMTWEGSGNIWAQRADSLGSLLWGVSPVAVCSASGSQNQPEILADVGGGAIIAWEDRRSLARWDIYAQKYDAAGVPQWQADGDTVAWFFGDSTIPDLVPVGPGQVIVGFQDNQGGLQVNDIHAQLFPPTPTVDVPNIEHPSVRLTAAPNPSLEGVTLRMTVPTASRGSLRIFDVAGRHVRTLLDGELSAGQAVIRWDGRDDQGREVAGGVYFARLRAGGNERITRVVRLGP